MKMHTFVTAALLTAAFGAQAGTPTYYPLGAQTNVPLSKLANGGWTQCYVAPMATGIGSNAENVLSACSGDFLIMAGRQTGSETLLALAAAPFAEAVQVTGPTPEATHVANGANWYFAPNWSWGFTELNDTVYLNSCDTSASPASMCLHTGNYGGYRINDLTNLFSLDYEKVFFVSSVPGTRPDTALTYVSKPVDIHVMSNDVGFVDPSTVDIVTAPQNGTVVVSNSPGNPALVYITYTPNAGFQGTDSFTYSAGDGALSDSGDVTVEVRAPEANPDSVEVKAGTSASIDVLANDTGFSDPVTVLITAEPTNGTAVVSGSPGNASGIQISYTPLAGFIGTDTLQYQVSDGTNTAVGTVTIEVVAYAAVDDTYRVMYYDSPFMYVAQNDIGFQNPVTVTILSPPARGEAHMHDSPGQSSYVSIHYTPEYWSNDNYTTSMTYQITDGVHTDTATVYIDVVKYLAQDDQASAGTANPVVINVTQNDLGFGYPRTLGIYSNPQHGTAVATNYPGCCTEPTITYTSEPGFAGYDTFQYAIDDGTHIGIATVTVFIEPDADRDGLSDDADNCVMIPNVDQRDMDSDGYGSLCDADFNNDGRVNFADLAMFRAKFGTNDPNVDMDGSGVVNFADLSRFTSLFGKAPGPSGLHP